MVSYNEWVLEPEVLEKSEFESLHVCFFLHTMQLLRYNPLPNPQHCKEAKTQAVGNNSI